MTNFLDIHAELASIMDILAKSAVAEISRLVDDGAALLRLEISRSHREIAVLRRNLQLKETELLTARRLQDRFLQGRSVAVPVCSVLATEREQGQSPSAERVFSSGWSFRPGRGEQTGAQDVDIPLQSSILRNQSGNKEKARPEAVLVKQERLEEGLCYRDRQPAPGGEEQATQPTSVPEEQESEPRPVEDGKKQEKEPMLVGDPEELSEQHRCEHGDEDLSGLEFVVKAEQEEEHVAQKLNQTGSEHSAGRLGSVGSEYVMYENDSQLWTSSTCEDSNIETDDPVCSNAAEQCSQSLSVDTPLHNSPAPMEVSGNIQSSFEVSYVEGFAKTGEKPSVCSEELRSEVIHTLKGQCRGRLGSLAKEDVMSQQQPQLELNRDSSDWDRGALQTGVEMRGKAHRRAGMGEKRFSCAQCGKSFTTRFYLKIHRRIHTGERPFNCTQCGKSFYCTSHLTSHQRSHTGEKPYSCDECGNSYSHLNSLKLHYRVHAEERELSST